mgnify:CR=1 FL=1
MAVKNDIGLKRYEISRDLGVTKLLDQVSSWIHLSINSLNHIDKFFFDG